MQAKKDSNHNTPLVVGRLMNELPKVPGKIQADIDAITESIEPL